MGDLIERLRRGLPNADDSGLRFQLNEQAAEKLLDEAADELSALREMVSAVRVVLEQARDGAAGYRQARIISALAILAKQGGEGG